VNLDDRNEIDTTGDGHDGQDAAYGITNGNRQGDEATAL
jgi:hypothetical protein